MGTACEGFVNFLGVFLYFGGGVGGGSVDEFAVSINGQVPGWNSQDSFPISSFAKYYPHVAGQRSDQHRDYST